MGVSRKVDDSGARPLREVFLGSVENALPQYLEASSAIHLSLQEF